MEWSDSGQLGLLFTVFGGAYTLGMWFVQRRLATRERACRLYDEFYSVDNYRKVVAPVMRLRLKLRGLEAEGKRTELDSYLKSIRLGWLGFESRPVEAMRAYIAADVLTLAADDAHFRRAQESERYTEHEALTVFLYFWTKVYALMEAKAISAAMTRRLFSSPYQYYAGFIATLREDAERHFDAAMDVMPAWRDATRELDSFFGRGGRRSPWTWLAEVGT